MNSKNDQVCEQIIAKKHRMKLTSSARISKTPKNLCTTEDEATPQKRRKAEKSMQEEIEYLRNKLKEARQRKNDDNINSNKKHFPARSIYEESKTESSSSSVTENCPGEAVPISSVLDSFKTIESSLSVFRSSTKETSTPCNPSSSENLLLTNESVSAPNQCCKKVIDLLLKLERQNVEIKEELKEIRGLLKEQGERHSTELSLSDTLLEPLKGFPSQTVEEFKQLDEKTNEKSRKILYQYLKNRGGARLREFLTRSLRLTMTDKLLMQYTWLGSKTHEKFGDSRICKVIYVAAKNCPCFPGPRDQNEFRSELKDLIRATKQRYRYSLKTFKETKEKEQMVIEEEIRLDLEENEDNVASDYSADYEDEDGNDKDDGI